MKIMGQVYKGNIAEQWGLHARTTLRLCTLNPRTTDDEIAETVRRLGVCARRA
jgi:hypothetical protein